jgi:dTDP-L-rhamnose 4-epimerase
VDVLVTGGAGFIGSHLVDLLAGRGHRVRVLDRLHPNAHDGPPDYLRDDVEYLWADLDGPALDDALDGVKAVCHQAAMVGLGRDFGDVVDYVRDNDLGTARLLAALHRRPGRVDRLLLASSMVVYGEGGYRCQTHGRVRPAPRGPARLAAGRWEPPCPACGRDLEPLPVAEDAVTDPRSVYAATKLHQEQLAFAAMAAGGPAVTALRYHNVYGPRMPRDTPYAGVGAIFRSALAAGQAPQVLEDGRQRRDFVHVRDVARATCSRWRRPTRCPGCSTWPAASPTPSGRWPPRLLPCSAGPRRRWSGAGGRATCATSSPRPHGPLPSSGSTPRSALPRAWWSSRPRRCGPLPAAPVESCPWGGPLPAGVEERLDGQRLGHQQRGDRRQACVPRPQLAHHRHQCQRHQEQEDPLDLPP